MPAGRDTRTRDRTGTARLVFPVNVFALKGKRKNLFVRNPRRHGDRRTLQANRPEDRTVRVERYLNKQLIIFYLI